MDEEWKQTLDEFGRVWPRVGGMGPHPPEPGQTPAPGGRPGPPPPPEREDARELEQLIRMETGAEQRYRAMAGQTGGKAAAALNRMAAGSRKILKRLQTEYYLRTGDSCPVPRERPWRRGLREELRGAWIAARREEKEYLAAAGRTRDAGLRNLYGDAAEQKQREQRELHALAQRMMA